MMVLIEYWKGRNECLFDKDALTNEVEKNGRG